MLVVDTQPPARMSVQYLKGLLIIRAIIENMQRIEAKYHFMIFDPCLQDRTSILHHGEKYSHNISPLIKAG